MGPPLPAPGTRLPTLRICQPLLAGRWGGRCDPDGHCPALHELTIWEGPSEEVPGEAGGWQGWGPAGLAPCFD